MKTLITLLIITSAITSLFAQSKKCDATVLLSVKENMGKLSEKDVTNFLMTFGKECENNAEFSEWSSELFFEVLTKQTELFVRTIEKQRKNLEMNEILDEFGEPVIEVPHIKDLIGQVEKINFDDGLKKEILRRLRIVEERSR